MNKIEITSILSETEAGYFDNFILLPEDQQIKLMESWSKDTRLKYLTREPAMTQQEFFAELDKIANGTFSE